MNLVPAVDSTMVTVDRVYVMKVRYIFNKQRNRLVPNSFVLSFDIETLGFIRP